MIELKPSERLSQFIDALQQKTSRLVVKTTGTQKTLELVPLTQELDQSYNAASDAIYQAFTTLIEGHADQYDKSQLKTLKGIFHKKLIAVKANQSGLNWIFLLFDTLLKTRLRNEKQSLIQLEKTLIKMLNCPSSPSRSHASHSSLELDALDLSEASLKPNSPPSPPPAPPPPPPPPGPPPPPPSANSSSLTNPAMNARRYPPLPASPSSLFNEPPHSPFLPTDRDPTEKELEETKRYITLMKESIKVLEKHNTALNALMQQKSEMNDMILRMGFGIERCEKNIRHLETETTRDFIFLEFSTKTGSFRVPVWTELAYRKHFPNAKEVSFVNPSTDSQFDSDDDDETDDTDTAPAQDSLTRHSMNSLRQTLVRNLSQSNNLVSYPTSSSSCPTPTSDADINLQKRTDVFNVPFMLKLQQERLNYCQAKLKKFSDKITKNEIALQKKSEELASLSITDVCEAISQRKTYIETCERIIKKREDAMKKASEAGKTERQNSTMLASTSFSTPKVGFNHPATTVDKFTSYFKRLNHDDLSLLEVGLRSMSNKTPKQLVKGLEKTILSRATVVEPVECATPQKPDMMPSRIRALQSAMHRESLKTGIPDSM